MFQNIGQLSVSNNTEKKFYTTDTCETKFPKKIQKFLKLT